MIVDSYGDNANHLLNQIESDFDSIKNDIQFAYHSSNPMDKRMEIAGYFLATIKVLDKQGEKLDRIREILLTIAREYVSPKNAFQRFLKKLPARIVNTSLARILLRKLDKKLSKRAHPDGFVTRIITDKKETLGFGYGIDIIECGICKLFEKHNYNKYTPILCEVDYITSGLAGLKLIRSGTIANGAEKCDFRFVKV